MIELTVTHRRHAENDTLNIRQEPSYMYNVIAAPFHFSTDHLALWLDIYTWSRRDPKRLLDSVRIPLPQLVGILRI